MKKLLHIAPAFLILLSACTKNYLDVKPDSSVVVPQTFQDLQALLDNTDVNNVNMPSLQEASSDDFYVTDASYQSVTTPMYKNAYVWNKDIYAGSPDVFDWNGRYQQVFYANVALERLEKLNKSDPQYSSEKGTALFFRAFALFQVAQLFCKPYMAATANNDVGIPVRTTSDINMVSKRATVQESYNQIISDLKNSIILLPQSVSLKTKPNQAAAKGLLARVYLSMADYTNALSYSDAALKHYSTLLDYNTLSTTNAFPFSRYNNEVIFHSTMANTSITLASRLIIDTTLYKSYDKNDLRTSLFFKLSSGVNTYKGSYSGSSTFFNGIATDELYLIRAECNARLNNKDLAMGDLNKLLQSRWQAGAFIPFTAATSDDALKIILRERHKQLIYRGLRWSDLRRLNQDNRFAVTLTRKLNGTLYNLPPNDPRYVLPIPDIVIQLSHIQQNPK